MLLNHEENDEQDGLAISDLMTALTAVFLIGSVLAINTVNALGEQQDIIQSRIAGELESKFKFFEKVYDVEVLSKDATIRFRYSFPQGSTELTKEMKEALDGFCPSLIYLVRQNKNALEAVVFEGHTNSDWSGHEQSSYFGNQFYANERAYNVMTYCLGDDFEARERDLVTLFHPFGYSYSKPVVRNGKEDKRKSKRVDIRLVPKLPELSGYGEG